MAGSLCGQIFMLDIHQQRKVMDHLVRGSRTNEKSVVISGDRMEGGSGDQCTRILPRTHLALRLSLETPSLAGQLPLPVVARGLKLPLQQV
jgi:hypothetical protein